VTGQVSAHVPVHGRDGSRQKKIAFVDNVIFLYSNFFSQIMFISAI